eukprot:TRINITY_DN7964_c0_g1_i5.p1 TRINITY_DN7964_c0_g1~~TRINITY_DN7964_c0_g1_i5.p1  ORF type:complete len:184 (+),score=34.82 TRINITY_DN7964_c0_g1_i5:228-779(+)
MGKMLCRNPRSMHIALLARLLSSNNENYNPIPPSKTLNSENQPKEANPFKKRPVKLEYKERDFATFYMPSEKSYFYAVFDPIKTFGHINGDRYSPLHRKQITLDSKIFLVFFLFNVLVIALETKITANDDAAILYHQATNNQKISLDDLLQPCLLYTSDAADDTPCVDLGGRRIIKKKKKKHM